MLERYALKWDGYEIAFQIYGKAKPEREWRVINVMAREVLGRRQRSQHLWACVIDSRIILTRWDIAEWVIREQMAHPTCRDVPVEIANVRSFDAQLADVTRHHDPLLASRVMAHECGHTYQFRRFLPHPVRVAAPFYGWRKRHQRLEIEASVIGQFGGIVSRSVHAELWKRARANPDFGELSQRPCNPRALRHLTCHRCGTAVDYIGTKSFDQDSRDICVCPHCGVATLVGVRWIRKLCVQCKEPYRPKAEALKKAALRPDRIQILYRQPAEPRPFCRECAGEGYSGYVGVAEVLVMDGPTRRALHDARSLSTVRGASNKTVQYPRNELLQLLTHGITSVSELLRVIREP